MSSPALAAPLAMQRETNRLSSAAGNASREQSLEEITQQQISQDDIAQLAYALWQRRGCPEGSAETDWLEAEAQLRR
jgi:hypothetical protein